MPVSEHEQRWNGNQNRIRNEARGGDCVKLNILQVNAGWLTPAAAGLLPRTMQASPRELDLTCHDARAKTRAHKQRCGWSKNDRETVRQSPEPFEGQQGPLASGGYKAVITPRFPN